MSFVGNKRNSLEGEGTESEMILLRSHFMEAVSDIRWLSVALIVSRRCICSGYREAITQNHGHFHILAPVAVAFIW